jgi:hypothetical protein
MEILPPRWLCSSGGIALADEYWSLIIMRYCLIVSMQDGAKKHFELLLLYW